MEDVTSDPQELNLPRRLEGLRNKLITLAKGVSRYRREAATHIFVFMISPESRAFKPYAVPVQCVPYVGMKESKLRELIRALIKAMVHRGMKVAGESLYQEMESTHCPQLSVLYLAFIPRVSGMVFFESQLVWVPCNPVHTLYIHCTCAGSTSIQAKAVDSGVNLSDTGQVKRLCVVFFLHYLSIWLQPLS